MSKLEPTRTSSDLTATERLRELLDERGVEYKDRDMFGKHVFHWGEPLHGAMFTDGGEWTELVVENASPEQAIAATLGDVPRLPHFWTHDGTLHVEATRMPTRIVVCDGGTCEFVPKRELDASEAENAKLRELVASVWRLFTEHGAVHPSDLPEVDAVRKRMRELGVEVE